MGHFKIRASNDVERESEISYHSDISLNRISGVPRTVGCNQEGVVRDGGASWTKWDWRLLIGENDGNGFLIVDSTRSIQKAKSIPRHDHDDLMVHRGSVVAEWDILDEIATSLSVMNISGRCVKEFLCPRNLGNDTARTASAPKNPASEWMFRGWLRKLYLRSTGC